MRKAHTIYPGRPIGQSLPTTFFIPKEFAHVEEYRRGFKLSALFEIYGTGIESQRDTVAFRVEESAMGELIQDLRTQPAEPFRRRYSLGKDGRDWTYAKARQRAQEVHSEERICPAVYRCFDTRYTLYDGKPGLLAYPRREVMDLLVDGDNVALIACRF